MWSVKNWPNPGLARISASRPSSTGWALWVVLICMEGTLADLSRGGDREPAPPGRLVRGKWYLSGGGPPEERHFHRLTGESARRSAGYSGGDRVADLGGTARGAGGAVGQVGDDRVLDGGGRVGVPEVVKQQRRGQDRRGGVRLLLPGDVGGRAVHGLEHGGRGAVRVDVPGRREPDAAGDRGGEVGDDVAEEVVGDDHVEARRVGGHEDRGRVDVQVVDADLGVLPRHLADQAAPDRPGVDQHVGLVDQGQLLARAALGAGERVADDPLDAERRIEGDLGGDLVRGSHTDRATVAGVGAFGPLADHHEVDLAGLTRNFWAERRGDAREDAGRAQVHVVVELEAQPQQQPALEDPGREVRVAGLATHRAEQDRVVPANLVEDRVREHLAGREVPLRAEVVAGRLELHPGRGRYLEHLERLGRDLLPDAVAGNDGEPEGAGGVRVSHVAKR